MSLWSGLLWWGCLLGPVKFVVDSCMTGEDRLESSASLMPVPKVPQSNLAVMNLSKKLSQFKHARAIAVNALPFFYAALTFFLPGKKALTI